MSYLLSCYTPSEDLAFKYLDGASNYSNDSGFDLYTPETIVVPAKSQGKIDFEVSCNMRNMHATQTFNTNQDMPFMLVPRSSIVKTPLRMSNSVGIIDKNYRGNLIAFVDNISDQEYIIEQGTRLFQVVLPSLEPFGVMFQPTPHTPTERGSGGFGSTGR